MSLAEFYISNGIDPFNQDSFDAFLEANEWEAHRLEDFDDEDVDNKSSNSVYRREDQVKFADGTVDGYELFVFGVGSHIDEEKLKIRLSTCGKVVDAYNTGKGYAFVTMGTKEEAQAAIPRFNGVQEFGRTIQVSISKRKRGGHSGSRGAGGHSGGLESGAGGLRGGGESGVELRGGREGERGGLRGGQEGSVGGRTCRNGRACKFKPICRFYHPEGGNDYFNHPKSGTYHFNQPEGGNCLSYPAEGSYNYIYHSEGDNLKMTSKTNNAAFSGGRTEKKGEITDLYRLSWEKANAKLQASVDQDIYDGFIQEQVNLLGGCKRFYKVVDASLRRESLNGFISEDQKALYEWRSNFFGDNPSQGESTFFWITDGNDCAKFMDTMTHQINENFDEVMKLAASTVKLDVTRERIFFEINVQRSVSQFEKWDGKTFDGEVLYGEDYDHACLIEDGGLLRGNLFDCKDCEGLKYLNKDCAGRKEKYVEYLLGSETIGQKYRKWRKEEDEWMDNEILDLQLRLHFEEKGW